MYLPLVSVIVPTRNRSTLLRRALESIQRQKGVDFEVLVIDDGSSEEHRAEYGKLEAELDRRFAFVLSSPRETGSYGPAENRNRGLARARGRFVAFLDDDDHWLVDDHLSSAAALLEQENADFLFATWSTENDGRIEIPDWNARVASMLTGPRVSERPPVLRVSRAAFCRGMRCHPITHLNGCVVRAEVARSVGGFWSPIHYAEDLHFACRVADRARAILYRTEPVSVLDVSPRPRAFYAYAAPSKYLLNATMAEHLAFSAITPEFRALAGSLLSWSYKQVSDALHETGDNRASLQFAFYAVAARVSPSTARTLWRSLWALLRKNSPARAAAGMKEDELVR